MFGQIIFHHFKLANSHNIALLKFLSLKIIYMIVPKCLSVLSKMEVEAANKQVSKATFLMVTAYVSVGFPLSCSEISAFPTFGLQMLHNLDLVYLHFVS